MNNFLTSGIEVHAVALMLLVLIAQHNCLEDSDTERSLRECTSFLQTNPKPQALNFHYSHHYDGSMGHRAKFSGKFMLDSYFRLHPISPVVENEDVTSVCVSIEDATTFTSQGRHHQIAYVTLHTNVQIPTCIVNVSTSCWKTYKRLETCSPVFIPFPGFMESALFNYSPLKEKFWNYVQDDTVYRKGWITGMDFGGKNNSVSIVSSWVARLTISNMTDLYMSYNDWKRPHTLLGSLPNLTRLDIPFNNIEMLPKGIWDRVPQLKKLVLNHNNFSQLPSGLETLKNLRALEIAYTTGNNTLSLSDKEISTFSQVEYLSFQKTKLKANVSRLLSLPNLKFLNVSECFLGKMNYDSANSVLQNSPLVILDLSFNNLTDFPKHISHGMINLTQLSLHGNELESCSNLSFTSLVSLKFLDLSKNKFSCLSANCFNGLHTLTELNLSWNQLTKLEPLIFRNSTLIEKLNLSHNKLSIISYEVFLPLSKLKTLDLSFNRLIQTPSLGVNKLNSLLLASNDLTEFRNPSSVKHMNYLDLSHNHIQKIEINDVHTLNLSYNSLSHIPLEMWDSLNEVSILELGGNHFDCCHAERNLLSYKIQNYQNSVQYFDKMNAFTCFVNDDVVVLLETLQHNSTICSEVIKLKESVYIKVGVGLLFLVTLLAVTSVLLYLYRNKLTYISHFLKAMKKDEERYKTCTYDAFVLYSEENRDWVLRELNFSQESDPGGYRLCYECPDFSLGELIDINFTFSLEKSRKVIVVLSQDFIQSRWGQLKLEKAIREVLEENSAHIILIQLAPLKKETVPKYLHNLMKTRGYLEWPEDSKDNLKILLFRKRLRDALGDSIFKRTGKTAPRSSLLDIEHYG